MSNAIINRIQAKVDELGLDQAAIYYSGDGPKGKITGPRLAEMIAAGYATPRMALKVCEDLELAAHRWKLAYEGSQMLHGGKLAPPDERAELELLREQNAQLASDNAALLARMRELDSRAIAQSGVGAQGFGGPLPFASPEPLVPATRQPWMPVETRERPADLQPWMSDAGAVARSGCD